MNYNKLIPELSVTNYENSKQFYTNVLNFQIKYERIENRFAFLELQGNQIMIEQINNNWNTGELDYPFGRGINISMEITNINSIYENVKKYNYPLFRELEINSYRQNNQILKQTEFLVLDPDGYLLRFNQETE